MNTALASSVAVSSAHYYCTGSCSRLCVVLLMAVLHFSVQNSLTLDKMVMWISRYGLNWYRYRNVVSVLVSILKICNDMQPYVVLISFTNNEEIKEQNVYPVWVYKKLLYKLYTNTTSASSAGRLENNFCFSAKFEAQNVWVFLLSFISKFRLQHGPHDFQMPCSLA